METLNLKQSLHAIADELPTNATLHDALERPYLLSKVKNAIEQRKMKQLPMHKYNRRLQNG
jgi:hypothetical protein